MRKTNPQMKIKRPMPPSTLNEQNSHESDFCPAPELWEWITENILDPSGPIHNPDHLHLLGQIDISVLWTASAFVQKGRMVVGQCEQVAIRAGGWQKLRQEEQLKHWFGRMPKFILTFAASYVRECTNAEFCALVEHELYHMKHSIGGHGFRFSKSTGLPILELRGHDVEEFVGVVRRYGPSDEVKALVSAANERPTVGAASIAQSCGTCLLRLA